jgi:hypothetical protein
MLGNIFGGNSKTIDDECELLKFQKALANEEIAQRRITAAQQQQMYGSSISGAMGSTQQGYNQAMQQKMANQAVKPEPRFDPNKSEAFQIPLSQAITLWKLKFGDTWYDAHQVRPDPGKDFYADVFDRIKKMGLFESTDGWYRLKEDA